jgi:ankyrin repeat protein
MSMVQSWINSAVAGYHTNTLGCEKEQNLMSSTQPTADEVREFVIAGHGNLPKVKQILAVHPSLLNIAHEWRPGDTETALQGAAHVGSREVAEFLLGQGAPLDICTAAMLGRRDEVERFLAQDPAKINSHGAHGIPLLTHAALSGDVGLVEMLYKGGATSGASPALCLAVNKGHLDMSRWLLENSSPDLTWKNFQGKTALEIANDNGSREIAKMLIEHGANL